MVDNSPGLIRMEQHVAAQGRPGRPKAKETLRKKATIGVRVAHALKRRLNEESDRNARPLSQEAEFALEAYFDGRRGQLEMLDLLYGREAAGLMLLIGEVAIDLQKVLGTPELGARSLSDPWAFSKFKDAVTTALDARTPPGEIVPPDWRLNAQARFGEVWASDTRDEIGRNVAGAVCRSIFGTKVRSERADAIRARIGRDESRGASGA